MNKAKWASGGAQNNQEPHGGGEGCSQPSCGQEPQPALSRTGWVVTDGMGRSCPEALLARELFPQRPVPELWGTAPISGLSLPQLGLLPKTAAGAPPNHPTEGHATQPEATSKIFSSQTTGRHNRDVRRGHGLNSGAARAPSWEWCQPQTTLQQEQDWHKSRSHKQGMFSSSISVRHSFLSSRAFEVFLGA